MGLRSRHPPLRQSSSQHGEPWCSAKKTKKLQLLNVIFHTVTQRGPSSCVRCPYPACEGLATLGTDEGGGDKVGVVVAFEVHVQQLLLSEGLLALTAGVRLLSSVGSTMHHHVTLLSPTQHNTQLETSHINNIWMESRATSIFLLIQVLYRHVFCRIFFHL